MKSIIRLKNKETGELHSFPSVADLCVRNDDLGISLNALYNALHAGKGFWENKKYQIYYETIDLGCKHWE